MRAFDSGVFFRINTGARMPDYGGGPIADAAHRRIYRQVYEIVTAVESAAFYMGYHLALGFAAGNCRAVFCADEKRCRFCRYRSLCQRGARAGDFREELEDWDVELDEDILLDYEQVAEIEY